MSDHDYFKIEWVVIDPQFGTFMPPLARRAILVCNQTKDALVWLVFMYFRLKIRGLTDKLQYNSNNLYEAGRRKGVGPTINLTKLKIIS